MTSIKRISSTLLCWALVGTAALPAPLYAALTDIADAPLALPAQNVKPNIMMLLDDSGSMAWQFLPDYVNDANCLTATAGTWQNCVTADPPAMSPDFNYVYYNPEIRYSVPLNYDGSAKTRMTSANTSSWTAVPTDNVSTDASGNQLTSSFQVTTYIGGGTAPSAATANLVSSYPDRVWCTSSTDSVTDTTKCKRNTSYLYPDSGHTVAKSTTSAPYYFRIAALQYCTDATLTVCTDSLTPTGAYTVPARVRFCDSARANCQAKRMGNSLYPNFVHASGNPTATIEVTDPGQSASGTITGIYVDGVNIMSGTVVASSGTDTSTKRNTVASAIATAINNFTSTPDYTATVSGQIVTISAAVPGTSYFGKTVVVGSSATATVPAKGSIAISSTTSGDSITSVTIANKALIPSTITCNNCASSKSARNAWMASALVSAINSNTTAGLAHGYTAIVDPTNSTNVIITAPSTTGAEMNGLNFKTGTSGMNATPTALSGGQSLGLVITATTPFTVGAFSRVDIVPYQNPPTNTIAAVYTKYPGRTDCAGSSCSYAEEMTNFANWYSYYRSRMQMAKSAISRTFTNLSDSFRVGFITINPGNPVSSSRYLKIDDFTSGSGNQKDIFYQRLFSTVANNSTPLREALSRVGRYYGNVTSGINSGMDASPIQLSCQPNYTILATDGYWNGNAGQTLTGGAIGNQDNNNSGYSTQAVGAWDGAVSGSTNTLADVAMYYYKTDLRTDLADNVPTTTKDSAPHQHMTTFTIGLGLAGQLLYDPNYETQTSGDFINIKTNVKQWPVPVADSESALDDLWHAAVNGRGKFFSARDPGTLTSSLIDTLNSVQSRTGAGAAAATSNLRPVSGDNFAFTAQYQTVEWTGDLMAKTLDLDTGMVSTRTLWSAQTQLDLRPHTTRKIYTYDPGDSDNLNKLKVFCWSGAKAVTDGSGNKLYPGCQGEPELSSTEMGYYNPLTLAQAGVWSTDGSGRDTSASQQNFIDYLRGDVTNEITGGSATTDLYRNRSHILGDIVNAQPAYVKVMPFFYNTGAEVGTDPHHDEFKANVQANRRGTVFVAANDGMLHAFETDPDNSPYYQTGGITTPETGDDTFSTGTLNLDPATGEGSERWAYIPRMVLPNIGKLAESPYGHSYFVDGTPVAADFCVDHTATARCASVDKWRTILVAGLNKGGRGYYALDITDPTTPKALWEFTAGSTCLTDTQANSGTYYSDCNVGYGFGNPQITKRASDERWVVLLSSGYNNVNPGDGKGYLYVLDAATGAILQRIGTGEGCDGVSTSSPCTAGNPDPSGLSRINNWLDNGMFNNKSQYVYGGDLWGNVWRFDLNANTAFKLAVLKDASGVTQPITTMPQLGEVSNFKVVYVATGRSLGSSDLTTTQRQTVYAIKDPFSATQTTIDSPRATTGFVQQTMSTVSSTERTITAASMDFSTQPGWYVDLPDGGNSTSPTTPSERVSVDFELQLGSLIIASNVPSSDTCVAGGHGWANTFNARTGSFITGATDNAVSTLVSASVVVGINVIQLPGGAVKVILTTADNKTITIPPPMLPSTVVGHRVSWRELIVQ